MTKDPIEILDARLIEDIRWVRLALGPKHSRWHCRWLHVFDGKLVATDGCRIHTAEIYTMPEAIAPGMYKVTKNTKRRMLLAELDEKVEPPGVQVIGDAYFRTLIRTAVSDQPTTIDTFTIDNAPVTKNTVDQCVWKLIRAIPTSDIGYNCRYLKEALFANQSTRITADINRNKPADSLSIRGATRTAVVQGMRV